MKFMVARYHGTCEGCFKEIVPGDAIAWTKRMGSWHIDCLPDDQKPPAFKRKDKEPQQQ